MVKAKDRPNPSKTGSDAPGTHPCSGFSFIEVIAILVLLGILTAAILPSFTNLGAGPVAEADILRSHIRFVQGQAFANNVAVWSINLTAVGYNVIVDGNPAPVNLPGENAPNRTFAGPVRAVAGTGLITFDPYGGINQDRLIVLSDGRTAQNVPILGFTGLVP
ncbi:MAG TPA: type II secretion system protein [Kiritimatiellia bacterium]|nr:type II secretion system protein [Kiritimatiellia bacterium]